MFGMLLYELIHRKKIFDGESTTAVIEKISKGERPPILVSCSNDFKELMSLCWDNDPNKRPSFIKIVNKLEEMLEQRIEREGMSVPVNIIDNKYEKQDNDDDIVFEE